VPRHFVKWALPQYGKEALRTRLPRPLPSPPPSDPPRTGTVVFVLPARNEEATVAGVVRRIPPQVDGRPVTCVVVDDGSTDGTADTAREAGAEVISTPGLGLGAALRLGLAEGGRRSPAAVVFCDADGEYAPEELGPVVAPIFAGHADYVVGSRFSGRIDHMRPHRRFGNWMLTGALAWITRLPVTDGQSGYRALSADAAASARIGHDYNYAQVLTLDLLAKGFRYAEVPISYSFRRSGRSFVHPVRYLRKVVPAVWRELNRPAPSAADVAPRAAPTR
jgi:glycosyltransferase involved in cell wall biosynthesis